MGVRPKDINRNVLKLNYTFIEEVSGREINKEVEATKTLSDIENEIWEAFDLPDVPDSPVAFTIGGREMDKEAPIHSIIPNGTAIEVSRSMTGAVQES